LLMPSIPFMRLAVVVLAILLTLDWFVGAMAYNHRRMDSSIEDGPKTAKASSVKRAA